MVVVDSRGGIRGIGLLRIPGKNAWKIPLLAGRRPAFAEVLALKSCLCYIFSLTLPEIGREASIIGRDSQNV